jgi:Putative capsular polysaccharide synthesis protein
MIKKFIHSTLKVLFNPHLIFMKIQRELREKILVLQYGKVGSRALVISLQPYFKVYQIHNMQNFLSMGFKPYSHEEGRKHGKRFTVITLVREPVGRAISAFFQNFHLHGHPLYIGEKKYIQSLSIDRLISIFHDKYQSMPSLWKLDWFDEQFYKITGIDVCAKPFDISRGWMEYENEFAKTLLIRFENLESIGEETIRKFIALSRFTLIKKHVSSEKWYGDILDQFLNKIIFSTESLGNIYNSKICKHFYSQKEIFIFCKKWARK